MTIARIPERGNFDRQLTVTHEIVTGYVHGIAQIEEKTVRLWARQLHFAPRIQVEVDVTLYTERECVWQLRRPVGPNAIQFALQDELEDEDGRIGRVVGINTFRRQRLIELRCISIEEGQGRI